MEELVVDKIVEEERQKHPDKPLMGVALWAKPEDQSIDIDYTTPMGGCSNLYYSLIFQMPKWGFSMAKVDEFMSVTPAHADAYNLTIAQKQKLEGQIKQGLASISQAVADYELIAHDYRRYREIYEYFVKGEKDEHVLRSLFVDRVDAFTGENYSMVTMARRWPTIITDFIRMKPDEDDVDKIRQDLDVSAAEATVLKTKNQLYKQWKSMFKPVVEQRLGRLKTLMDSRKRSVEDYKKWLKPYVARHKMMRDSLESKSAILDSERTSRFMTYGFSQAVADTGVRLWAWKPFITEEVRKPESAKGVKSDKWMIDPYDDWVKSYIPRINAHYDVKIDDKIVEDIKATALMGQKPHKPLMEPDELYYLFFDMVIDKSIIRTAQPEGGESEDMMFLPLSTWILSQNVLLLYLIELRAIELSFEKEIDDIIGIRDNEADILNEVREEVEERIEGNKIGVRQMAGNVGRAGKRAVGVFSPLSKYFVKQGPYENNFKERITKVYMVGSGMRFGEFLGWLKKQMGAA